MTLINKYNPLLNAGIQKVPDDTGVGNRVLYNDGQFKPVTSNGYAYAGSITVAADFPTLVAVVDFSWYNILGNVTDNDITKTNTGTSWLIGDEIYWDGTTWQDYGNVKLSLSNGNIWVGNALNSPTEVLLPVCLTDGDKGDITIGGTGTTMTIDSNAVDNSKLAKIPAYRMKGNNTGVEANALDLTTAEVKTLLSNTTAITVGNVNNYSTWLIGTTYNQNDVVKLAGVGYKSKINSNIGNSPDVNLDKWDIVVPEFIDITAATLAGHRKLKMISDIVESGCPDVRVLEIENELKPDDTLWNWDTGTNRIYTGNGIKHTYKNLKITTGNNTGSPLFGTSTTGIINIKENVEIDSSVSQILHNTLPGLQGDKLTIKYNNNQVTFITGSLKELDLIGGGSSAFSNSTANYGIIDKLNISGTFKSWFAGSMILLANYGTINGITDTQTTYCPIDNLGTIKNGNVKLYFHARTASANSYAENLTIVYPFLGTYTNTKANFERCTISNPTYFAPSAIIDVSIKNSKIPFDTGLSFKSLYSEDNTYQVINFENNVTSFGDRATELGIYGDNCNIESPRVSGNLINYATADATIVSNARVVGTATDNGTNTIKWEVN